ncbi:ring finger domain-containing protein, partial [Cryptosporidium canis]
DEPGAGVEASDTPEDETSRIYNLIGFNPFEGGDSQERRDDALQALKVVSNALIKLSGRYDQLKEKSSKWKARCHQLKDSHTSSINECNFLKERLRSLQKTLEASGSWRNPGPADTDAPRPASSAFDPGYLEDGESFSHISKLIQDRRSSKALGGSGSRLQTNKENQASGSAAPVPVPASASASASSLGVGPRPGRPRAPGGPGGPEKPGGMHTDRESRAGRVRPTGQEARTDGSPAEDSPNPSYSSLIRSRKGHVMKRNVPRDSQSISSFFYTRRPKLKLVD